MSPSAEPVQQPPDLDSRVEEMLREAGEAAADESIVRQRVPEAGAAVALADAEPEPAPVDAALAAAAGDAGARRAGGEGGSPEPVFEDAESVLGGGGPDVAAAVEPAGHVTEADFSEADAASIEELDAALAERAAAVEAAGAASGPQPLMMDDEIEPQPESAEDPPRETAPVPIQPSVAIAAPAAVAPAARETPARIDPPPPDGSPAPDPRPLGSPSRGLLVAISGLVAPLADRALGGVSRRLERLSPGVRQTISWAALITALNAAAVWTVVLLRTPDGVHPTDAATAAPAAVDHAGRKGQSPAAKSGKSEPTKAAAKPSSKSASSKGSAGGH